MPKRPGNRPYIIKHLAEFKPKYIRNQVSRIFDVTENYGITNNHGSTTDIWGETDYLPNSPSVQKELAKTDIHSIKKIIKQTRSELIITPSGNFLYQILEKIEDKIISHIDFKSYNEVTMDVLYYPSSPHFNVSSCIDKGHMINTNFGTFSISYIDQVPKNVGNNSILSLISHFRQNQITGITLEQWIINYLFEQLFIEPSKRTFNSNEIIFETVLPQSQSCIQINFDSSGVPNIFLINKFDILDPTLKYRHAVNI